MAYSKYFVLPLACLLYRKKKYQYNEECLCLKVPHLCGGMGGRGCCCLGGRGCGGVWWLLPELLAGVPPPLPCVGTCGGGRSSGVRLTSGVPCDPLWPPLLPRLPSAVTLSSSLSSESAISIIIIYTGSVLSLLIHYPIWQPVLTYLLLNLNLSHL